MSEQPAIVPLEKREVDFYGDVIPAALVRNEGETEARVYVPLRPICAYLEISWPSQRNRINRDDVLREEVRFVSMMNTNPQGGDPEVLCLPLEFLPGWLFGIDTNRVKPDLREKITRYRRECYRVLWNHFKHDILPAAALPAPPAPPLRSGAQIAYELASAVQHLAQQQMEMEQRLDQTDLRVAQAARWARTVNDRLDALELVVGPGASISEEQAAELALAVKNVAKVLEQAGQGNSYARVYAELYRRYDVTSYKSLERGKFSQVMTWLREWYDEVTGGEV